MMKKKISGPFILPNPWISWAVLQPHGYDNHFSVVMYFCKTEGKFSHLFCKGIYYLAISMNFITNCLILTKAIPGTIENFIPVS